MARIDVASGAIGLGVDWSILETGRVKARIADASLAEQLASWRQTMLEALGETETAMVRYGHALEQDDHLQSAASVALSCSTLAESCMRSSSTTSLRPSPSRSPS